jgi:hypothetical protein
MASAAAEKFFNSQSPQDRLKILESWNGADLKEEWYQNAKNAGSVPASGAAAPAAPTTPSAQDIRNAAAGNSEDFGRFSDQTINEEWGPFYDAAASQAAGRPQYRSARGAPGFYDKPTECPAGQSPSGPHQNSPCKSNQELLAAQGQGGGAGAGAGAGAAAAAPGADAAYYGQDDPLQRYLVGMMETQGGSFTGTGRGGQLGGGGVWSQAGPFGAPPTANTGITGGAGMPSTAAPSGGAPTSPSATPPITQAAQAFGALTPGGYNPGSAALQALGPSKDMVGTIDQASGVASPFAAPRGGTLEDMINPARRRPRDARTGGSWF